MNKSQYFLLLLIFLVPLLNTSTVFARNIKPIAKCILPETTKTTTTSHPVETSKPKEIIKCGHKNKNKKCPNNTCCSKDGICSNEASSCGKGCQPKFGHCFPFSTDATCGAKSVNKTVCPNNDCCSQTGFCGSTYQHCVPSCQKDYGFCGTFNDGLEVISTCTIKNSIALTYDDGPRCITNTLLDKLKKHDLKATFFVNGYLGGSCIYDNANVLQRAVKEGHQIASHTWSHPHIGQITKKEIIYQIDHLETAFKKIIGTVPKYFRPPYGEGVNVVDLRKELIKRGYKVILWDVDTRDWAESTVKDSEKLFSTGLKDKKPHISLSHDRIDTTVNLLADFEIKFSLNNSYNPMTVGECTNDPPENWYRETPKFGIRDDTWKCDDVHVY